MSDGGFVIKLLAAGVPLTLLLDLALPFDSRAIYRNEQGLEEAKWLTEITGGHVIDLLG